MVDNTNFTEKEKDIARLERKLIRLKRKSSIYNSLVKLKDNDDFNALIYEWLFQEEAKEIFDDMIEPKTYASVEKVNCEKKLEAITFLKSCLGYESDDKFIPGSLETECRNIRLNISDIQNEMQRLEDGR